MLWYYCDITIRKCHFNDVFNLSCNILILKNKTTKLYKHWKKKKMHDSTVGYNGHTK